PHRLDAPTSPDGILQLQNQPGYPVVVSGRLCVVDRRLRHGVRLEPHGRTEMKILDQIRLSAPEFCPQQLAQQMVVAVPLTATVERDDEQVPGFQSFEDIPRSLLTQDRIAERPAHPVQDRGTDEERNLRG